MEKPASRPRVSTEVGAAWLADAAWREPGSAFVDADGDNSDSSSSASPSRLGILEELDDRHAQAEAGLQPVREIDGHQRVDAKLFERLPGVQSLVKPSSFPSAAEGR